MTDETPILILGHDSVGAGLEERMRLIGVLRRRMTRILEALASLEPMDARPDPITAPGGIGPREVVWPLGDGQLRHSSPNQSDGTFRTSLHATLPGARTNVHVDHGYTIRVVPDDRETGSLEAFVRLVLTCIGPDDSMIADAMPERLGAEWALKGIEMHDLFDAMKRRPGRQPITAFTILLESETPLGHGIVMSEWTDRTRMPGGSGGALPGHRAPGSVVGITISAETLHDGEERIDVLLQNASMRIPGLEAIDRLRREHELRTVLGRDPESDA
jgi:hypothetical protein